MICLSLSATAHDDSTTRWIEYGASLGVYGARYSNVATQLGDHDLVNSAPRDGIHVNIISGSLRGRYDAVYGAVTLQLGDYPRASWMTNTYWLQEAYVGVHLNETMRLEAGSFSSHVGVESMIPSENHSGIISLAGFFDPNYFGGVKYLWDVTPEVEVQANLVTSFNGYEIENNIPAFTTGATWQRDSTHAIAAHVFVSRETIEELDHTQLYINLASTMELPGVHLLGEFNYALELPDGDGVTHGMVSGFIAGYVDLMTGFTAGLRGEFVIDPDGILADDRFAAPLPFQTFSGAGATATVSYEPYPWLMVRGDVRLLTALDSRSFIEINPDKQQRSEVIVSIDVTL